MLASAATEGRPRPTPTRCPRPRGALAPDTWTRQRPAPQRQRFGARAEAHRSPQGQGVGSSSVTCSHVPPSKGPPTRPSSAEGWEGLTALRTARGAARRPTSSRGHPPSWGPACTRSAPLRAGAESRLSRGWWGGVGPGAVGEARGPTHGAPRRRGDSSPAGGGRSRRVEPGSSSPLRPEAPGPTCPLLGCQETVPRPLRRRGRGSETGRRGCGLSRAFRGARHRNLGCGGDATCEVLPLPPTPGGGTPVLANPDLREPWTGLRGRRGLFSSPRAGPSWRAFRPLPRLRAPPTGCTPSSDSPPGDSHSPPDSWGAPAHV